MIMPQCKVSGRPSKPNWCIVTTTQPGLTPKTPSLPTSKAGITANAAIQRYATLARNSSNNSFCLNAWSSQRSQDHRDLEEMMLELGLKVDHSTSCRWVVAYAP